jgi:hypothetical protein
MRPDVAVVEVINDSSGFFFIKDADNNEIARFRTEVKGAARRNQDGSISFTLKLLDVEFHSDEFTIYYGDQKIEPQHSSTDEGNVFNISIPENQLKNEKFTYALELSSDNSATIFEKIRFIIMPNASLETEIKEVCFGHLTWDHQRICGNKQTVSFNYSVLKSDAKCRISSAHRFHLKSENNYLPYSLEVTPCTAMDNSAGEGVKSFQLNGSSGVFSIIFDPSSFRAQMPIAGDYEDYLTIELMGDD